MLGWKRMVAKLSTTSGCKLLSSFGSASASWKFSVPERTSSYFRHLCYYSSDVGVMEFFDIARAISLSNEHQILLSMEICLAVSISFFSPFFSITIFTRCFATIFSLFFAHSLSKYQCCGTDQSDFGLCIFAFVWASSTFVSRSHTA